MPRSNIERIREMIRRQQYDMSAHAMEEMVEDGLDIEDVEQAILNGRIAGIEKDDLRGTKYVVEGIGADGLTLVGNVGRFTGQGRYLIITVYEITAMGD
jgi:hypothetical protein